MKSIVAFSDSHNLPLTESFEKILAEADYIFFLGDGLQGLSKYFVKDNFYAVKGNCDFMSFDKEMEVEIEGVKFLLTHGNRYRVKSSDSDLFYRAKEVGAQCVLFGHTHISAFEKHEDVCIINPGSISCPRLGAPSYAYINVINKQLICKIVDI